MPQRFPSATAYREALQDPATCFADPELAEGEAVLSPLGLPVAVSGNVACIFRVDCPSGRSYAVRCFVRAFEDQEQRYRELASHLAGLAPAPTWRVAFDYQTEGIVVEDEWWPVLKMAWSAGEPLLSYVERHLWDGSTLAYLAIRFAELVADVRAAGVAHGDLQHGNILVAPGGDLRLIDYDSTYVPGLAGLQSNELGHRNYQHPGRRKSDFGPHLDDFPSWVIYASLVALSTDPLLWGRLDGGDECLLFRRRDLADPSLSLAFATFEASADPTLVALGRLLRTFAGRDVTDVPALRLADAPKPAAAQMALADVSAVSRRDIADQQRLYAALRGSGHPDAGRRPIQSTPGIETTRRPEVPGAPAVPTGFSSSLTAARATLGTALVLLVAVLVLTAGGSLPPLVGAVIPLAVAGGAFLAERRIYEGLPEVRRASAGEATFARERQAVAQAQEVVEDLVRCRRLLDEEEGALGREATERQEEGRRMEASELRTVEDQLRLRLAALAAAEQEVFRAEHHARASALRDLRGAIVDAELVRRPLSTLPSISDQLRYALALDGVRTAADFVDVVADNGNTALVHRDGHLVRASALGPDQARSMMAWRRAIESAMSPNLPASIDAEVEHEIRQSHECKRSALAADEDTARVEAEAQVQVVRARWNQAKGLAAAEAKRAQVDVARRRVELDDALSQARKDVAEAEWRLRGTTPVAAVTAGRGPLSFAAFLRAVVGR